MAVGIISLAATVPSESLRRREHLEDIGLDERIILEWILEK
jgi:hypothetical protein